MSGTPEWIDRITETDFITNEAGDEVFWPTGNHGYYDAFMLRAIADELDKMNGPWNERVEEYFEGALATEKANFEFVCELIPTLYDAERT